MVLQTVTSVTTSDKSSDRLAYYFAVIEWLAKGGATPDQATELIKILHDHDKLDYSTESIEDMVMGDYQAILHYKSQGKRFISREVENFVAVTNGYFSVTDGYNSLQAVTKEEKNAVRVALLRLHKRGIIEKASARDGVYRKVETDLDFISFDEKDELPYPVTLPFGLHDMVEISAGNIILVGGEFNAGKTTFMLQVLMSNKNGVPIRYISSEVSTQSEFKKRWRGFRGLPLSFWLPDEMTDYVSRSSDFAHALRPGALNIIDYLEFPESDYTMGAEVLRQIHDKLDGGVAVVAVQKKKGQRLPRSGDLIMEKPRLAVTLSSVDDTEQGVAEIVKAKICKGGKHDGKKLRFEIVEHGSTFKILQDWGFLRI